MKTRCAALLALLLLLCPVLALASGPLADGDYTVEVTLSGGSGRATVESPAQLSVRDGSMTATLLWSSPFYEFMVVDGVQYDPIQTEGNAAFTIPVTLDEDLPVQAQTVAMSEPHLIDYTLHLSDPVPADGGSGLSPVIPAVAAVVLVLAVGGLVLRRKGGSR